MGGNVVIVRVKGGLGNQLFQYACGFAAARMCDARLQFDCTWFRQSFEDETPRQFLLEEVLSEAPTPERIDALIAGLCRLNAWPKSAFGVSKLKERIFGYDDALWCGLQGSMYLDGYWQSWKYFDKFQDELRSSIFLHDPLSLKVRYKERSTVSVHVRRGDYVQSAAASHVHGVCGTDYYLAAMDYMRRHLETPKFFMFSDDIAWCRSEFKNIPDLEFVPGDPERPCADLASLSSCDHQIIANSTFSWWGAYLNDNPEKRVVCPSRWFAARSVNSGDLYPSGWHSM